MRTIRHHLTRQLLAGFALLLAGGGIGVYFSTRTALVEQFDETLRAKANAIRSATEQHGRRIDVELSDHFMRGFDEGVPVDFYLLRRADGSTARSSKSLGSANLATPALSGRKKIWNLTLPTGNAGRAIGYTFSPRNSREENEENAQPTELSIVVASDRRELNETLLTLGLVLSGCGILLLGLTAMIVPRVLQKGLKPLDQLADQAAGVTVNSLSTRFPTDSVPGELKPISIRLNDLLSRLALSFERERQFSANLAHELRTPIAELRTVSDLALKWPETRPPETDQDTREIAEQMEGIVVRLLELLRSEDGQLVPVPQPIALTTLANSVWKTFAGKAAKKQIAVVQNIPEEAKIISDPVLVRSILTNLLDNAVEYTPFTGKIRIDCGVGNGHFTVRISNTCERLESSDLPKFFDRFWRKDPSRSGNNHSGLGLPLARTLAETLGCELAANLHGGSELVVTLSGPADFAQRKPLAV